MPILDVQIVLRPRESIRPKLAAELAKRAGEIFKSPQGSTWVKVHAIAATNYAENDGGPTLVYPVFVSVLKARMPSPDQLKSEVEQLTKAVARACTRPEENVHILYLPEGAGRVAFGGRIV